MLGKKRSDVYSIERLVKTGKCTDGLASNDWKRETGREKCQVQSVISIVKDGGIPPISVGYALRRLAAKCTKSHVIIRRS